MELLSDVIDKLSTESQAQAAGTNAALDEGLALVLDEMLDNAEDISGAIVSSVDGLARAKRLRAELDEHRFAAMSSALLALSDNLNRDAAKGKTENVLIEGTAGKVFLLHAGELLLLTVFTHPNANLGMSLAHARQAAEKLAALSSALA